ncbi:hypothetical protein ACJIZ3_012651 [Penstemon smallii]|uniref:Uncharacterized protein n=1 Tax=Penstemon smallii TaxID=265156 RepID=A0ABD3UMN5_9LAMI
MSNMFTNEELSSFYGVLNNNQDLIEIDCGCTIAKYGDTPGKLRIFANGKIEIDCNCIENCPRVNLSPIEFAKHAGRANARNNWKSQIWVFKNDGEKVALRKTCLLKYHIEVFQRPLRKVIHRDEFLSCSRCSKDRRFFLRSREDCKIYHNALIDNNWKCSDMTNRSLTCNDDEERQSRRVCRGCPRSTKCEGCEKCVCLGCNMCRFADCSCGSCVDFIQNM